MGKLFGTDGIRGVANQYPMTPEMAVKIGRAVATVFRGKHGRSGIVVGRDTRISGTMIESALVSGICSAGTDAKLLGVIPTPGVAFMATASGAAAGIVISASHNPFYDNGIKIFKGDGFKLSDQEEGNIEALLLENQNPSAPAEPVDDIGRVAVVPDAGDRYRSFLKQAWPERLGLHGVRIVMDCANGATCRIAPALMAELGADVHACYTDPDGKNINAQCGSQHPEILSKLVIQHRADIGLSFDGDGDRLIAADENGRWIDGDRILGICAESMKKNGQLKNECVVSTVMSNMGLGIALKKLGIAHEKAPVGDRYVMEKMVASGAVLGGENSGHMIFLNHHTTGDGILAAMKLLEAMRQSDRPLSELAGVMTVFPQKLINVDVAKKPPLETVPEIQQVIQTVEDRLGDTGRVLVRYSGTQPMCRVMVEGPTAGQTERYCRLIAEVIERVLG